MTSTKREFTSVEICAGAGGQALGLHNALFRHLALIEIDPNAVATLRKNVEGNAEWEDCKVKQADLTQLKPLDLRLELGLEAGDLDLLAAWCSMPAVLHRRQAAGAGRREGPVPDHARPGRGT